MRPDKLGPCTGSCNGRGSCARACVCVCVCLYLYTYIRIYVCMYVTYIVCVCDMCVYAVCVRYVGAGGRLSSGRGAAGADLEHTARYMCPTLFWLREYFRSPAVRGSHSACVYRGKET